MTVNAWSSPFSDYDMELFYQQMIQRYGAGVITAYRTLKYAFLLGNAATDYGSGSAPLVIDVLKRAASEGTAAGPTDTSAADTGWPGVSTTQPQEPSLGANGELPTGTSILIGGIGVVVLRAQVVAQARTALPTGAAANQTWEASAAADDALSGLQAAFDCANIYIDDARNNKAACSGHEAVSWGSSTVAVYGPPVTTTDGVSSEMVYAGQVPQKDRGWCRLSPAYFDGGGQIAGRQNAQPASQLKVRMEVPRSTAWPIRTGTRFRVEVLLPSIVAYQSGSGAVVCDPATGLPIPVNPATGQPAGAWSPPNQRTLPPSRW